MTTTESLSARGVGGTTQGTAIAIFGAVVGVLRGMIRSFIDMRERRAAIRLLESLDERALADMGVNRGEIRSRVLGRLDGDNG